MDAGGIKKRDYLFALLLLVATTGALGLAQQDTGVMRDEGTYFDAARSYWGWFAGLGDAKNKSFTKKTITRYWRNNNEHPVFFKTLFALSWRYLGEGPRTVGPKEKKSSALLSSTAAFRAPAWLFTGIAVALIFLFGIRLEGRITGLTAALLYITIPRVFFHGQLACFDSGITTFWLLVVYAYFRSLDRARWGIIAGLLFGFALATKHNAWFVPALLLIHYLVMVWPDVSLRPFRPPRAPLGFIAMAILGPIVFYAHWPWLWFDTFKHLKFYFNFHLKHAYYNMEYLGVNWGPPPLPVSYPFGMTLFTVSTLTLLLALAGLWVFLRTPILTLLSNWVRARPPAYDSKFRYPAKRSWLRPAQGLDPKVGLLLGLNALFPLFLIALPKTPIFGGTKHWMPAYPFIALLAGIALERIVRRVRAARPKLALVALALPFLVALPGAANIALTHPYGLSQYNALAGGPAGGADWGLNRQFWGFTPYKLFPWLNKNLKPGTRIYYHDINYSSYAHYRRQNELRSDLHWAGHEQDGIRGSSAAMVMHELHFNKYDYWIWKAYGSPCPVKVLTLDGVPLVSVYARPNMLVAPKKQTPAQSPKKKP
jgi:4-amino-4-deoxy-L-arabinose transferase-like glycosyltransferase